MERLKSRVPISAAMAHLMFVRRAGRSLPFPWALSENALPPPIVALCGAKTTPALFLAGLQPAVGTTIKKRRNGVTAS